MTMFKENNYCSCGLYRQHSLRNAKLNVQITQKEAGGWEWQTGQESAPSLTLLSAWHKASRACSSYS